jgi:hypothetical protein
MPRVRGEVPAARWCNWCGAPLRAPSTPTTGRHRIAARVAGVAIALAGAAAVVTVVTSAPPTAGAADDAPVVLAEDVGPPPAAVVSPSSTESRTDVVCSDLRRRSVPTRLLDDTEPGTLAQLSWGPCVVIGPEGATLP